MYLFIFLSDFHASLKRTDAWNLESSRESKRKRIHTRMSYYLYPYIPPRIRTYVFCLGGVEAVSFPLMHPPYKDTRIGTYIPKMFLCLWNSNIYFPAVPSVPFHRLSPLFLQKMLKAFKT